MTNKRYDRVEQRLNYTC